MDKIEIAKIVKPQGVRGDVKIVVFADKDLDFSKIKQVFVQDKVAVVEKVYSLGEDVYGVKLDIINTRNDAELYRGKLLYVDKTLIDVKDGRYLIADLLNKTVILDDGTTIGKIVDVQNFGSADIFYVNGSKKMMCCHKQGLIKEVKDNIIVFDGKIFGQVAVYED